MSIRAAKANQIKQDTVLTVMLPACKMVQTIQWADSGGLQRARRRWTREETAVAGGRAVCVGGRMDGRTRGVRHE